MVITLPSLITQINEARKRYLDLVNQIHSNSPNNSNTLQTIFSCFNVNSAKIFTFDPGHKVQYIPINDANQIVQANNGNTTMFPVVWNQYRAFGVEYDQYKGNTWRGHNVHWYPLFLIIEK